MTLIQGNKTGDHGMVYQTLEDLDPTAFVVTVE